MWRPFFFVIYYGLLRHLPPSTLPGGRIWRSTRSWVGGRLLEQAGAGVNIEHGADFGSGKRIRLGDRSGIGINARVLGTVHLGRDVMMGPDVFITSLAHRTDMLELPMIDQGGAEQRVVVIEDDVWIGARAIILPGVRIASGAIVGAGAVVTHDVPPKAVVAGNPARVVKYRGGT